MDRVRSFKGPAHSNHQVTDDYLQRPEHTRNERWRSFGPLFGDELRTAWKEGNVCPLLKVYVGHHKGVLGVNPFVNIGQGYELRRDGIAYQTAYKTFSLVIGSLAVVIQMGIGEPRIPSDAYVVLGDRGLKWPLKRDVDYEDYFELLQQPNGYGPMRSVLSSRVSRRRFEREWRQSVGTYSSDLERMGLTR